MANLLPDIQEEYERWLALVGDGGGHGAEKVVGIRDVLWAHFLLIDYFTREGEGYGGVGPRDLGLLHSALDRQFVGYGHRRKWESNLAKCATLFYGLIMNHPFHDCNKRTAFLVLLYHLDLLGRTPDAKQREYETLAVRTSDHRLKEYPAFNRFHKKRDADVLFIADFLRKKTRKVDKRYYVVTYNDLQTILGQFDCRLANPHDNHIDVEKLVETKRLLGIRRAREHKRVAQIGFPGWTKQVGRGAIKTVRSKTGLTPENGYDSKVFFHGISPVPVLIDKYRGVLKRLADR